MADAYSKVALTTIALALIAVAVHPFVLPPSAIGGAYPPGAIPPTKTIEIPKAWGRFSGAAGNGVLYFEASDGTIRAKGCGVCVIVRSN
jgi:hypothetical protein